MGLKSRFETQKLVEPCFWTRPKWPIRHNWTNFMWIGLLRLPRPLPLSVVNSLYPFKFFRETATCTLRCVRRHGGYRLQFQTIGRAVGIFKTTIGWVPVFTVSRMHPLTPTSYCSLDGRCGSMDWDGVFHWRQLQTPLLFYLCAMSKISSK